MFSSNGRYCVIGILVYKSHSIREHVLCPRSTNLHEGTEARAEFLYGLFPDYPEAGEIGFR